MEEKYTDKKASMLFGPLFKRVRTNMSLQRRSKMFASKVIINMECNNLRWRLSINAQGLATVQERLSFGLSSLLSFSVLLF